jgi:hypothetical protein
MDEPQEAAPVGKKESVLPSNPDTQQQHEMQQFKTLDFRSVKIICRNISATCTVYYVLKNFKSFPTK